MGFQKNEYFLGVCRFCGYSFWVFTKLDYYLGVISMHLRVNSLGQCTEWGIIFWAAKISNIFLGA